ncbi:MAG: threonylcarbamoyl-AMP synthase [Thermoplasmata archaeon]|nr:MAG: threonylcarbamoyl-AMP synthase [Thermoplasmata archaeon]
MRSDVRKAIEILRKGELVVYPTDTLYGLGADIFNEDAVRRVYEIKRRPPHMPLAIMLSSVEEMGEYAFLNPLAEKIINAFMPGPITIILKKRDIVPDIISKDSVGIRVVDCQAAREIAAEVVITATSANLHGGKQPCTIDEAKEQLGGGVAFYMDYGKLPCTPPTVVDVSEGKLKIIREGAIGGDEIYGRL